MLQILVMINLLLLSNFTRKINIVCTFKSTDCAAVFYHLDRNVIHMFSVHAYMNIAVICCRLRYIVAL